MPIFSLEQFCRQYETEKTDVIVAGNTFCFFKPKSIEPYIDPTDAMQNFPLWTRIWEASTILGGYLLSIPPDPSKKYLEIGSGLGVAGVCAATAGHRITMTENNKDALNFARANAVANGFTDLPILALDWHSPQCPGKFDFIVGSEVIYRKEDIVSLQHLFNRYLNKGGEIILAESIRETGTWFWNHMKPFFNIKVKRYTLKTNNEKIHLVLFHMKHKNG